jgi:uncharacterized membrane protein
MYLLGNILGRLLFSYLFVWVINLLFVKFNYKAAVARTHSKVGLLFVAGVYIVPILVDAGKYL